MGFRDVKRSKSAKDTRIIAIINQKGGVETAPVDSELKKKTLITASMMHC